MDVSEFYSTIGANYDLVKSRLGSDEFISKYLKMFEKDSSFAGLVAAANGKNWAEAFRMAYSLKGVVVNLELAPLADELNELTELLRAKSKGEMNEQQLKKLMKKVTSAYGQIVLTIKKLG